MSLLVCDLARAAFRRSYRFYRGHEVDIVKPRKKSSYTSRPSAAESCLEFLSVCKDGALTRTVPASGEVSLSISMFHPRVYSGPPTRNHKCAMAFWPSRLARSSRTM